MRILTHEVSEAMVFISRKVETEQNFQRRACLSVLNSKLLGALHSSTELK